MGTGNGTSETNSEEKKITRLSCQEQNKLFGTKQSDRYGVACMVSLSVVSESL